MMWPDGCSWFWMFGGIWMIIFWGALIALVVWAIKKLTGSRSTDTSAGKDPLDIAKERYARGEISRTDFEQLKKDLS
jgi:putative membrane protein